MLELLWKEVNDPGWVPNLNLLRATGRLVKSRIKNEMDGA